MMDILMLLGTIVFFAVAVAYTAACDQVEIEAFMNLENIAMMIVSLALMVYLVYALAASGEVLMTMNGWFQILLFFAVVLAATSPLGYSWQSVFRERTWLDPVLRRWSG